MRAAFRGILAVGLIGVAACVGCDWLAYGLVKTVGPFVPPDEVKAEFSLKGQSVLVLVDVDDPVLASEFPRLRTTLSESIRQFLEEHHAAGPIVSAYSVEAARRAEPDFNRWSIAQVGSYFNVDLVLHVAVYDFRLQDLPAMSVFHGYSESAVRVVSPETGEQIWPALASARLVTAEAQPDVQPEEASEGEKILVEGLAQKIARHFFTYKVEDLPKRPKVR